MNSKTKTTLILIIAGIIFIAWLLYTPPGLLGKADAVGYAVCHRIEIRSFHIIDRPIALCARCTGQYLGAVIAILYAGIIGKRRHGWPNKWAIAVGVIFFLAYGIDGTNSYLHFYPNLDNFYLYEPNNVLRLLTGTGMGLVMGFGTWIMFQGVLWREDETTNTTMPDSDTADSDAPDSDAPILSGVWQWGGLFAVTIVVLIMVLTENPLFLYPLSLISALGVLGLLTILYAMIWIMLFRAENTFTRPRELLWPLAAGFTTAMLQIWLLDFMRYWATGTWGGFHLG